jgi:hypothetical protein
MSAKHRGTGRLVPRSGWTKSRVAVPAGWDDNHSAGWAYQTSNMISTRDARCRTQLDGHLLNSERASERQDSAVRRPRFYGEACAGMCECVCWERESNRRWTFPDSRWRPHGTLLPVKRCPPTALQIHPRAAQCGGEEGTLNGGHWRK